jgi:tripartite-type tricarboxylate transporter receptor subunit TctC
MLQFRHIFQAALYSVILLVGASASAQSWPSKTVRIVVPFSPGGSTDAIARLLAKKMEPVVRQSVVVENISGGGSIIGVQSVVHAPADGSSMVLTGSGTITVMKHTNSNLPVDPEATLTPITFVNTLPHWIVVRADRPEKTFPEFVEYIRKNPGKVNISVNTIGGAAHLALANWAKTNGLDISIVPYRGSSAAMVDLLGGVITAHVDVIGSSLPFVKAKRAKALAVLQRKPIADLPDVPASPSESNGGLLVYGQHVLAVKTGTPSPIVDRMYEVVKEVTAQPDFVEYLRSLGFERTVPTPSKSKEILDQESKRYADIVRATNIRVN